jgi:hypothetical protein
VFMKKLYDLGRKFEYENGFYATTDAARLSKILTHYELFKMSSDIRGEIVECGVFKGNSLFRWIKFRDLLENTLSRKVIGFDAFGAFPKTDFEEDKDKRDAFINETDGGVGISKSEMIELLEKTNLNRNVELIEGDILLTLPQYLKENPHLRISLLHIDVDIYEPTKLALKLLIDRVTPGGILILDDYGAFSGTNQAVLEILGEKASIKKLPFSNAIGYIIK